MTARCDFCGEPRAWIRTRLGSYTCERCRGMDGSDDLERPPDERLVLSEHERAIGAEAL